MRTGTRRSRGRHWKWEGGGNRQLAACDSHKVVLTPSLNCLCRGFLHTLARQGLSDVIFVPRFCIHELFF